MSGWAARRVLAAVLLGGALLGCSTGRRVPQMQYYILTVPGTPATASGSAIS